MADEAEKTANAAKAYADWEAQMMRPISRGEALFASWDENDDGSLTHGEIKRRMKGDPSLHQLVKRDDFHWADLWAEYDTDSSGQIDKDEFARLYDNVVAPALLTEPEAPALEEVSTASAGLEETARREAEADLAQIEREIAAELRNDEEEEKEQAMAAESAPPVRPSFPRGSDSPTDLLVRAELDARDKLRARQVARKTSNAAPPLKTPVRTHGGLDPNWLKATFRVPIACSIPSRACVIALAFQELAEKKERRLAAAATWIEAVDELEQTLEATDIPPTSEIRLSCAFQPAACLYSVISLGTRRATEGIYPQNKENNRSRGRG